MYHLIGELGVDYLKRRVMWFFSLTCYLAALQGVQTSAHGYSRIIVFGDSCSETGNAFELSDGSQPPFPAYFDGRWTNGPVWVEYLAERLGVPTPLPSLIGGTNYAFAGAETGTGESSFAGLMVPNVGAQIEQFIAEDGTLGADTLVSLWAGINDFNPNLGGQMDASVVVGNLSANLTRLHEAGAREFVVSNLFPEFQPAMSQFNDLWWSELNRLESELSVRVHRLDFDGLVRDVFFNPQRYGLANVTDPALDPVTGEVVPNPSECLIWDSPYGHLTTRWHEIVADQLYTTFLGGDYNSNGIVEQADLDLVLLNWGEELFNPYAAGWINDIPSGVIDQEELDKVLLGWGNSVDGLASASVPEPATVGLLLFLLASATFMLHRNG